MHDSPCCVPTFMHSTEGSLAAFVALPPGRARELSELWHRQAGPDFDLAILVLAVFNVAAACGIISTIFYDARVLAKSRSLSKKPNERIFLRGLSRVVEIHPAEVVPLATSIAIAIQGIIYVAVQSIRLDTLVADCESIAKVVWPGKNPSR
ncbi:MAG: hypothetical protein Q9172_004831 [Xanthocarpia lactea]